MIWRVVAGVLIRVDLAGSVHCWIAAKLLRHYCEHVFELGVSVFGRYEAALAAPEELYLEFGSEREKSNVKRFRNFGEIVLQNLNNKWG